MVKEKLCGFVYLQGNKVDYFILPNADNKEDFEEWDIIKVLKGTKKQVKDEAEGLLNQLKTNGLIGMNKSIIDILTYEQIKILTKYHCAVIIEDTEHEPPEKQDFLDTLIEPSAIHRVFLNSRLTLKKETKIYAVLKGLTKEEVDGKFVKTTGRKYSEESKYWTVPQAANILWDDNYEAVQKNVQKMRKLVHLVEECGKSYNLVKQLLGQAKV